ncbi:MAG: hypothetical protein Kow0042_05790 [Calditrichia bacterium]
MNGSTEIKYYLGNYTSLIDTLLNRIQAEKLISRIWKKDHTIWKPYPDEIANRLGWLIAPTTMMKAINEITDFVDGVRQEGLTHVLLLGMGGSSLAPEVFRKIFGVQPGYLDLAVLDSTHPEAVLNFTKTFKPEHTLYLVSTKSGSTVETSSFMKYFYNLALDSVGATRVGRHFAAITDSGSQLHLTAEKLGFRKTFLNDPDVGGRYSALTYFGLVPAALIGVGISLLLKRAYNMALGCGADGSFELSESSPALLGAVMGALAQVGHDKLTFFGSKEIEHFSIWVEQLIAESTGKEGKGILPVVGETLRSPDFYRADRLFIHLRLKGDSRADTQLKSLIEGNHPLVQINLSDNYDLGGEFYRWEMATAVAGWILGINPFDQPDVESAKVAAREMVAAYKRKGKLPELRPSFSNDGIQVYTDFELSDFTKLWKNFLKIDENKESQIPLPYIAIHAYLNPTREIATALQNLRNRIQEKTGLATTWGFGPRFLHSTGQLHKGDAGNGRFIQIVADFREDVSIPDQFGEKSSSLTFGTLEMAQSLGDRTALLQAGRNILRFHLDQAVLPRLEQLIATIE